jgi:hypothetical protein
MSGKLTVTCLDWKPLKKGSLIGFAKIRVGEMDLTIQDVALHRSHDRTWAALPARAWIRDGRLVLDNGKIQYSPAFEFGKRETRDAFSAAVVRAVNERFPDALALTEAAS